MENILAQPFTSYEKRWLTNNTAFGAKLHCLAQLDERSA
jgi:hypothetical protein